MERLLGSRGCIVCGQENPVGLHLCFRVDGEGAESAWVVRPEYQGFAGVLHGGMVLALLDDAMWYAVYAREAIALTAEATVRYRARAEVGQALRVRGTVVRSRGRLFECGAELIRVGDGTVLASAEGKFVTVPADDLGALVGGTGVHEVPRTDILDPR